MTTQEAFALALQYHQDGRLEDAAALYRQILAAQPDHADSWQFLGVIAHQTGRHDLAFEWIGRAVALNPHHPGAYSNLGETCRAMGRLDEAITAFRRALALQPASPDVHNNLGNALRDQGRLDEAVAAFRRALELQPDLPEAYNNLANALAEQGQFDEAADSYRRALQLKPDYPEASNNLGTLLASRNQLDAAVAAHRRALQLKPDYADAHYNLGSALRNQGRVDEAVAAYRQALKLQPNYAEAHSTLIFTLYFHPQQNDATIAAELQRWNRQFAESLKHSILPHRHDRDPHRPLKIGYVSPYFGQYVIGRNILPLFRCHDSGEFEIVCYSGVSRTDGMTEEFRRHARHWRSTIGVSDEVLAAMIRQDGVDILVDLTLHGPHNRLPVFARQPAPVQVSFIGYPESTGLETIGYRISDRYLEPEFEDKRCEIGAELRTPISDSRSFEQVCLIESFLCYDPCGVDVKVNGLPAQENGYVTFGSLNDFAKLNEPVLRLWARVLSVVRDSRLVLLASPGSHRQRTVDFLRQWGVDASRVEFFERCSRADYLALYHRLDVALDPFPYGGHTTSLDALWMGVPVVSLVGPRRISRVGWSHLPHLGLEDLGAFSEDDYVNIATRLALDLPRLANLRAGLRARMQSSVLMDAPRYTRNIEAAYRAMWRKWCAQAIPEAGA